MPRSAVFLSGSVTFDGAEIHEGVFFYFAPASWPDPGG